LALVVEDADHSGRVHEADILAHLETFASRGSISKYGIPEKIQFVDRLPKTSVGKIDKKRLRETYGQVAAQK
jgi:fatty-acyl-CoA synthase